MRSLHYLNGERSLHFQLNRNIVGKRGITKIREQEHSMQGTPADSIPHDAVAFPFGSEWIVGNLDTIHRSDILSRWRGIRSELRIAASFLTQAATTPSGCRTNASLAPRA